MFKLGRSSLLALAAVSLGTLNLTPAASALSTSDRAASILVWPLIVADPDGVFGVCESPFGRPCSAATAGSDCGDFQCLTRPVDTLVTIANTTTGASGGTKLAQCFLTNTNNHCDNSGDVCNQASQCGGGTCVPGITEIDFRVFITEDQPVWWYASEGRSSFALDTGSCALYPFIPCVDDSSCSPSSACLADVCEGFPFLSCENSSDCPNESSSCITNAGSVVPPLPELPFQGSLTCIELDPQDPPVPDQTATRDSLIGQARILRQTAPGTAVDLATYDAVGVQATGNGNTPEGVLQIGRDSAAAPGMPDPTQEYEACPANLLLPHVFDGAVDPNAVAPTPGINDTMRTELTLVPCGHDFVTGDQDSVAVQFLVFNEFEQRFSTSTRIDRFLSKQLSLIDTHIPARSIWAAGVSGTIAGYTRIRGGGSAATGRGLHGVARLFMRNFFSGGEVSNAFNLGGQGDPRDGTAPDLIVFEMP